MYRREIEALVRESGFTDAADGVPAGWRSQLAHHREGLEMAVAGMVFLWAVLADAWAIWALFLDNAR